MFANAIIQEKEDLSMLKCSRGGGNSIADGFGVYLPLRQRRTNTMAPASTAAEIDSQRRASVAERLSA